jgi:hypothetical protein
VPPLWTVRRGMSRGVRSGYGGSGGNGGGSGGSGDVTSSQRKTSRLMNHAGAVAGAASQSSYGHHGRSSSQLGTNNNRPGGAADLARSQRTSRLFGGGETRD